MFAELAIALDAAILEPLWSRWVGIDCDALGTEYTVRPMLPALLSVLMHILNTLRPCCTSVTLLNQLRCCCARLHFTQALFTDTKNEKGMNAV